MHYMRGAFRKRAVEEEEEEDVVVNPPLAAHYQNIGSTLAMH